MNKFPSSIYPILPITDEKIYLKLCDWAEEISDMTFEDPAEQDIQYAQLDAIVTLIKAYEDKESEFKRIKLTIPQVIEQALEQLCMDKKELNKLLGSNRVSELFNGKRPLSLNQIKTLHKQLRIPTDLLVGV